MHKLRTYASFLMGMFFGAMEALAFAATIIWPWARISTSLEHRGVPEWLVLLASLPIGWLGMKFTMWWMRRNLWYWSWVSWSVLVSMQARGHKMCVSRHRGAVCSHSPDNDHVVHGGADMSGAHRVWIDTGRRTYGVPAYKVVAGQAGRP
jgi:hypothetical protein